MSVGIVVPITGDTVVVQVQVPDLSSQLPFPQQFLGHGFMILVQLHMIKYPSGSVPLTLLGMKPPLLT